MEIREIDSGRVIYSITNQDLQVLEDIFISFNKKFINYLDLYKDTRLYENHITYLIEICNWNEYKKNTTVMRFKDFLTKQKQPIMIVGD